MSLADIVILISAACAVAVLIIVKAKNFTKKDGGCCGCDGCSGCAERNCAQCAVKDKKENGTDEENDCFG